MSYFVCVCDVEYFDKFARESFYSFLPIQSFKTESEANKSMELMRPLYRKELAILQDSDLIIMGNRITRSVPKI